MKVILLENVKGIGKKDEIINASDGYARNYLLPKKLAVPADAGNLNNLKAKQESHAYKRNVEKEEAEKIKAKLSEITLTIKAKAGETGKIFGGVTTKEISEELKKKYNIEIDKKKIVLNETIKVLGTSKVDIRLFEGVIGNLKISVVAQ